jgi:squalene-associated FAD-dependent desaturase
VTQVVVIGGGFAGLAAAVELAAQGLRPLLLEARPHLGGRAYSFTDAASGEVVDNGQHAMMGCYTHTLSFLERIGAGDKVVRQDNLRVAMARRGGGEGLIAAAALPSPLHMLSGVLGYKLLHPRERRWALLGGMRMLWMYRRNDARLQNATVSELLHALGQSPNTQSSFWNPIALATLNEAPQRAAAAPFAAVLARAFFGSRRDSQFVLPGVGLSEMYTADALRFITERGGGIERHANVVGLDVSDDRVTAVRLRDGRRCAADACIVAVPPRALAALLPAVLQRAPALRGLHELIGSPIVSVHLWLDRPVLEHQFLGLLDATTQWFFNRTKLLRLPAQHGQCVSAVISAAHDVVQWDNERIAATVVLDLRAVSRRGGDFEVVRSVVVKEKHATMSTTPATDRLRPPATTPIDNLFLAGDWTATGLPPTIESAVMSGERAAVLLVERLRARPSMRRSIEAESVAPRAAASQYRHGAAALVSPHRTVG